LHKPFATATLGSALFTRWLGQHPPTMLRKIDTFIACVIMLTGCAHALSVFHFFHPIIEPNTSGVGHEYAFWWVAGGINLVFGGTFNLLRIKYGSLAPGILKVCLLVNLLMLLYEIRLETNNLDFITIPRALLAVFQIAATALNLRALILLRRHSEIQS
jgi:hypothetical protein